MNKSILLSFILLITVSLKLETSKQANPLEETIGINFFQGTLLEARAKANKENKLIFIDCFTTWCGPCKSMSKKIFTQKDVGDFYNKNFICVKMDMDLAEGISVNDKYIVDVYPTYLFIDSKGTIKHRDIGYIAAKKFIELGKTALAK